MSGTDRSVKRTYDASRRRAAAAQQLESTLDHASALLDRDGYPGTTVAAIAVAAGVSPATIYKTYGGKPGLVRELCRRALAGVGPIPAESRSDEMRATAPPAELVAGWGELAAEVAPRISPLVRLLHRAAEVDPEAAELLEEVESARLARMSENAAALAARDALPPGTTTDDARDVLWLCTAPETYDVLVTQRGWTSARFGAFITTLLEAALLRPVDR